jgi:cytochrome b561
MNAAPVADLRYDRTTIALHWLTAVLVVLLWGIAHIIGYFPKGAPRVDATSVHMTVGLLLGLVVVTRIIWRLTAGRRLPSADAGALGVAARGVHALLYVLIFATVVLGIANASEGGDSFYNLFKLPAFVASNGKLADTVNYVHGTLANAVLILAGLHALAGLAHHYVWRDGVLRRMLPAGW